MKDHTVRDISNKLLYWDVSTQEKIEMKIRINMKTTR